MTTLTALANAGLVGLQQLLAPSAEGPDTATSVNPVDDDLRLLAILNPMLRALGYRIADAVTPSPARATLLALLVEDLARTAGRAQLVAAGKLEESDAHMLKEQPPAQQHELHTHLEDFVHGTTAPPVGRRHSPAPSCSSRTPPTCSKTSCT